MPCFSRSLIAIAFVAALLVPAHAHAGDVDYVPFDEEESAILDELGDTFTRYAYSVDRWLKIEVPDRPEMTHRSVFNSFESGFQKSTIARMEYTYTKLGRQETVTYHAMSGTEPDEAFTRLLSKLEGLPASPMSPAADQFERTRWDVRSVSIDDADSDLRAIVTADGLDHSADAELKALRNLERDLRTGKVARNGQLRGSVSKMPCQSCRGVFDELTDLYPMTAEIAYPSEESAAAKAFLHDRKTIFRTVKINRATTEPTRTLQEFQLATRKPPCR